MAGGYTGHLVPRETRKGKHYQMAIEGPRDPVTGRRNALMRRCGCRNGRRKRFCMNGSPV